MHGHVKPWLACFTFFVKGVITLFFFSFFLYLLFAAPAVLANPLLESCCIFLINMKEWAAVADLCSRLDTTRNKVFTVPDLLDWIILLHYLVLAYCVLCMHVPEQAGDVS